MSRWLWQAIFVAAALAVLCCGRANAAYLPGAPVCTGTIPISQTTSTDLRTFTNNAFICSVVIVSGDAESTSLVQGTGTTCGTGTVALIGGTTAATGMSLAPNGGIGVGNLQLLGTGTGQHLCLLQSGTGRLAGVISYVDQSGLTVACTGVAVTPASGLQNAINANGTGTTFCLAAGTYNESITPKTGDTFWGAGIGQTIFDGQATRACGFGQGIGGCGATDTSNNVTVKNLTVRNYNYAGIDAAGFSPTQTGWLVDTAEVYNIGTVSATSGQGFGIWVASAFTIQNSIIHDNYNDGFRAVNNSNGNSVLIQNNDVYRNMLSGENPFCCSADKGNKFTPAFNITVQNNKFHDQSSAFWCDSGCDVVTFANNEVFNCTSINGSPATNSVGVFYEVMVPHATGTKVNNITNNYIHDCNNYGIEVANSGSVNITGNALSNIGSTGWFMDDEGARTDQTQCGSTGALCLVQQVNFTGNWSAGTSGQHVFAGTDAGTPGANWKGNNNTWNNNTWYLPSSTTQMFWDSGTLYTFPNWQAHGLETTSTVVYNGGILPAGVGPRGGFVCSANMGTASGGLGICP